MEDEEELLYYASIVIDEPELDDILDAVALESDVNKKTTLQKIQEILTKQNGYKIEKTDDEKRISRNKGDNSKVKIVAAEEYEKI